MDPSTEPAMPVLTMPNAPLAFHVMAKPTGATCNLDCEYCFFLSKEMLYPGSRFRMAADLQETYIRQLMESQAKVPELIMAWQGGEPTMMGLDFFRRAIELQATYAEPGPASPQHPADERHAARRRVGRVPVRERVPRRHLHRRAAGDARRVSRRQGREADVRPGHPRPRRPEAARRRLERPDHGARRQRRPRPRRLPIPARRPRRRLRPVHPDHRTGHTGDDPDRRQRVGERGARSPALRAGRRSRHPSVGDG